MWNLKKKKDTNEIIHKTETDSETWERTYSYQGAKQGGEKLGVWD